MYGNGDCAFDWIGGEEASLLTEYALRNAFRDAVSAPIVISPFHLGGWVRQQDNLWQIQVDDDYSTVEPASTFRIKNDALPAAEPECYILRPLWTCLDEQYAMVKNSTAVVKGLQGPKDARASLTVENWGWRHGSVQCRCLLLLEQRSCQSVVFRVP